MEGAIVAVTHKTRTAEGVRPPAIVKHLVGLVLLRGFYLACMKKRL
jgi:hypothetical protein